MQIELWPGRTLPDQVTFRVGNQGEGSKVIWSMKYVYDLSGYLALFRFHIFNLNLLDNEFKLSVAFLDMLRLLEIGTFQGNSIHSLLMCPSAHANFVLWFSCAPIKWSVWNTWLTVPRKKRGGWVLWQHFVTVCDSLVQYEARRWNNCQSWCNPQFYHGTWQCKGMPFMVLDLL